jgi:23S rRNA (guanosine2251-2'-O)-methyltransferase
MREHNIQEGKNINKDIIEGRNPVFEAIMAGRPLNRIIIADGAKDSVINKIIKLAKEKHIVLEYASKAKIDKISITGNHQGLLAISSLKEYVNVEDIISIAYKKGEAPFIIVLDRITDIQNLGSILRTADAVGAHGIIIPKRRAAGLNSTVGKVSAGAVEYVPVARVTNITRTIEYMKENNIWIIGTDAKEGSPFYEADLSGAVAIVIGSEGKGIGRLVRETCDIMVNIPMKGNIQSLNAGVAAAVIMYEVMRQRV